MFLKVGIKTTLVLFFVLLFSALENLESEIVLAFLSIRIWPANWLDVTNVLKIPLDLTWPPRQIFYGAFKKPNLPCYFPLILDLLARMAVMSTIYSIQPSQHTQSNLIWWAVARCGFHIYRRIDVKLQFSELTKLIEGSTVLKQSKK